MMGFGEKVILAVISSSALTGAAVKCAEYLVSRFGHKQRERMMEHEKLLHEICDNLEGLRQDNIVMMHDRIYDFFRVHQNDDYLTAKDRSNLDYLFERYTANGGNHNAEILYQIMCEKEVRYTNED